VKKQWPYFLLAFVVPVTAMLWWWGLFSSATVEIAERGGYRYAYLDAQGVYSKLTSKQKEVLFELKQQGINPGVQVTLMLSDPRITPHDQLQARTGFMISADAMPKAPLKTDTIPVRQVAVAHIKAHPLFAYGKTYSALLDFAEKQKMSLQLPTLELYDASVLSVEMPLASDKNLGATP
jgi:DNA gyrase inhibitor GyrI